MGALAGLVAHGGVAGAIVESLVAVAVIGVLAAVWLRERKDRSGVTETARLRDEDEPAP